MTESLVEVSDPAELRRAFTLYPRGVMAVAALVDGEPAGLAVSAFVSVSLDPPLLILCIDAGSRTWPVLSRATAIGVSVLAEEHEWLGRQLASRRGIVLKASPLTRRPMGHCFWPTRWRGSSAGLRTCIPVGIIWW